MEQIIKKLKEQARSSWTGEVGDQRAKELENYLRMKLDEYSSVLNISQEEILIAWEKQRTYPAINYYQEANQPTIDGKNVKVFDSVDKMMEAIEKKEFRCPSCNGISTSPYECNSGKEVDGETCDWKVYGFFGDLGQGAYVFIKDKMCGENLFMPLSWEYN